METEKRIEKLERENGLTRLALFVSIAALFSILLIGAISKQEKNNVLDEVRAREFLLVDDRGEVRAQWSQSPEAQGLAFYDNNKKRLLDMGCRQDGTYVGFSGCSRDGKAYFDLVVRDGIPRLLCTSVNKDANAKDEDTEAISGIELYIPDPNTPSIRIWNRNVGYEGVLAIHQADRALLGIKRRNSSESIILSIERNGEVKIVLEDGSKRNVIKPEGVSTKK